MNEENGMFSVQTTAGRRIAQEEQTDRPAGKKTGLIIGIVAGALVLGYAALCVVAQTVYGHRAFPNTTVLGLDVSGMSAQQAEQLWQEKGAAVLEGYRREKKIEEDDVEFLLLILTYPVKYWKLMNQYINGKKSWMSSKNMEKLIGVREQEKARENFIKEIAGNENIHWSFL